ncbi:hypothetical protein KAS79_03245 [Candidatus Parcubacteria bacterium]|nr:hypothetical protein [Candidatus Parcubacteria bacterium]
MIENWSSMIYDAFELLVENMLNYIPGLIAAILVLIIGWFVAAVMGKFTVKVLESLKFNQLFERGGWKEAFEKAELKVNISEFIGAIVKWIFVIVSLLAAVDILGLGEFANFLRDILNYLPNVVVAVVIFVVAVIIADILEKITRAWVEQMRIGYGSAVGTVVRWSIWIFAIMAILMQLGIALSLIQTLFTGFVAMLVIAGGLAFGLGGKDVAAEILQEIKAKLQK